jgi:hypothetical protein
LNFGNIGFGEIALSLVIMGCFVALAIWPAWRIVAKTGNAGVMSLALLVPVVNIIMILYFAFSEWPIERELKRLRQQVS